MGLGDVLERVAVADVHGQGAHGGRGGEVAGGLSFRLGREVVTAEQAQGDVVEQQRPEGEFGAFRARTVGGDDSTECGDRVVQVGVVRQGHLDDAVHSLRSVRPNCPYRILGVQGHDVRGHGRVHPVQVGGAAYGADHRGPAPAGELGRERAHTTEAAMKGYGVRYTLATKLVNELVEAADEKQLNKTIARYGRVDLLCIDELGYMELDRHGAELLFQVLTEREEKNSVAIASNDSFGGWTKTFTDPRLCAAIVDRLTFNGTIIETGTDSYRLASTRARAEEPAKVS